MILWAALIAILATLVAISAKVRVGRPKQPKKGQWRDAKPPKKPWDGKPRKRKGGW